MTIPLIGSGWAQLDPELWPVDLDGALSHIEAEAGDGEIRTFNEFLHGGYLIRYHPKFRVFIDDRCELYRDAFLVDLVDGEFDEPGRHIESWYRLYKFRYAMPKAESGYDGYLAASTDWELLERGRAANLYRRKERKEIFR